MSGAREYLLYTFGSIEPGTQIYRDFEVEAGRNGFLLRPFSETLGMSREEIHANGRGSVGMVALSRVDSFVRLGESLGLGLHTLAIAKKSPQTDDLYKNFKLNSLFHLAETDRVGLSPNVFPGFMSLIKEGVHKSENSTISIGSLEINTANHKVEVGGINLPLTPIEYRLLVTLASNPDQVVSHRELLGKVWGSQYNTSTESSALVRVRMSKLRGEFAKIGAPDPITTVLSAGYLLQTPDDRHNGDPIELINRQPALQAV